jgi:CPA2 family monovalent cation:H+ antiporter-2
MEDYYSLVIIAILAFVTPLLFARTSVPVVVGEMVLGLLVGAVLALAKAFFGYDLLPPSEAVEFLAFIGFIFLMFLAGLEIDFSQLEVGGRRALTRGVLIFVLTILLAYPMTVLVLQNLGVGVDPLYLTFILSTTAVALVLTVLREMRLSRTSYGQQVIIAALVADMSAMIMVTVYAINIEVVNTGDLSFAFLAVIVFASVFVSFFLIYKIGSLAIWRYPNHLARFFRPDDPSELGVRMCFAVIFLFFALSMIIGSEALTVLGAFLAGTVMSLLFQGGALLGKKLFGIGYGFLVPIFFINLGISFDFQSVLTPEALILLPLLFGVTVVSKVLPSILLSRRIDLERNLATGVLLTGGLTLMIASSEIGFSLGIIDATMRSVIILLAIILGTLTPILFKRLHHRYGLGGEV